MNNIKKLIVGKNSRLVKELKAFLTNEFDYASHAEVGQIRIDQYQEIFVFSWSNSLSEMQKLLSFLPSKRVVLISSMAVYGNLIFHQFSRYPKVKLKIENLVLDNGGKVIRLGFFDLEILKRVSTPVPVSSLKGLSNELMSPRRERISEVYDLVSGTGKVNLSKNRIIYQFLSFMPLRIIVDILLMVLRDPLRNYSRELIYCFSGDVQLGHGALGGYFLQRTKNNPLVITLDGYNQIINANGFRQSVFPGDKMGLGKSWHGVSIDGAIKKVPFYVRRYPPKTFAVGALATKICSKTKKIEVTKKDCPQNKFFFPFQRVTLAMGCIENVKFIKQYIGFKENVTVHDHEIGVLGDISIAEGCERGFVKKILGILILRGRVLRHPHMLIDVRPSTSIEENIQDDFNLLNRSFWGIVWGLLSGMSFRKINQAAFNKYGIGFATARLTVYGQFVSRDCVSITELTVTRRRLQEDDIAKYLKIIEDQTDTFKRLKCIELIDGMHYQGGEVLLKDPILETALEAGEIRILGSPTLEKFDECHTTERDKSSMPI